MSRNWLNLFSFKRCGLYTEKHETRNRLKGKYQTWKSGCFKVSYVIINQRSNFLLRCPRRRATGEPLHQETREAPHKTNTRSDGNWVKPCETRTGPSPGPQAVHSTSPSAGQNATERGEARPRSHFQPLCSLLRKQRPSLTASLYLAGAAKQFLPVNHH